MITAESMLSKRQVLTITVTLLFRGNFCIYLALSFLQITSMEEHHELKVEQFQLAHDSNKNKEYIQFKRSDQRY